MNKKVKTQQEAWKIEDRKEGQSSCWIQWKGTNVCMDFHCLCGCHGHIDDDFVYAIKCPKCGKIYSCSGYIELIEIEKEPESCVVVPE